MADRKEILLEVKSNLQKTDTEVGKLVQSMTALNKQIYDLTASQKQLQGEISAGEKVIALYNKTVAEGKPVSDQLRQEFERATTSMDGWRHELTATNEALKAHKKEYGELSRQVQNTIISEETYKDTLKGMAAQLSVEKDKLRQIKIAGGELTDEYKRQQEVVNNLNTKVSTLEQAYGVYTRNVGNYKSGVQELNEMLRQHLLKLGTLKEGTKEWEAEAKAVQKTTQELEQLNREQEKADKQQLGFFGRAKAGWAAVATKVMAIVAAVTAFIRVVSRMIKTSIEFQQQQRNLQTILGATDEQMQVLTEHAKELGRTTEYTASQVTELQIALAKLGFSSDQIRQMSGAVLALATDLDAGLGEAAELTGATLRQFNLEASNTEDVVNILVKGANESALSFDKYRTALAQVAPVANAMGFDLKGTVAILGALANVGMDASMAATSTRNIMLKLADSSSELAKSLSQPVKDIPTLVAGLKELQARGIDVATALELTDKRSVAAFTSLMKNADAIDELNQKLQDLDGYAIGIREERLQTVEGSIKMLTSAWEGFTLAVNQSNGALKGFIDFLTMAVQGATVWVKGEQAYEEMQEQMAQNAAQGGIAADWVADMETAAREYAEKGLDVAQMLGREYNRYVGLIGAGLDKATENYNATKAELLDKRQHAHSIEQQNLIDRQLDNAERAYNVTKRISELQGDMIADAYKRLLDNPLGKTEDTGGTTTTELSDTEKKQASQVALKELASSQKIYTAMLAQQKRYQNDAALSEEQNAEQRWQHEQDWQKRNFENQQTYEREKLRIQLQYDQITGDEYRNSLKALDIERETFYQEQEQKAVDHYTEITKKIVSAVAGTDVKAQIRAVEKEYKSLYDELDAMVAAGQMTYEEATYYKIGLEQKKNAEIKKLRKQEKDDADKQLEAEAKKRADQLATDLKLAWQNAEQQYQIRKRYLEQELQLYKDNAAKRAELEEQLAALESAHQMQKIERLQEYGNNVQEMLSSISTIATNNSNARVQEAEQQNEQEKAALDKRLKAGLIAQKQYDDKVAKLDTELAQKKAEETRKQAIREKELASFQIVLNTAAAIMKIWAEVPKMDFGVSTVALTAVAAAMGALQLGAVLSEPLPKARRGGKIEGAKHEQGGVLVETEGEERIVAARPAKAFPELLNLISYIGKNAGVPDTGYALRRAEAERAAVSGAGGTTVEIDYDRLGEVVAQRVGEEIKNLQVWLSLTELRDAQDNVVHLDELTRQ
jgi:TP901 family phage tail tape measure protein